MKPTSRRNFIRTSAIVGAGICSAPELAAFNQAVSNEMQPDLYSLSSELLRNWTGRLLQLQIRDKNSSDNGAFRCPACSEIHGRIGDAIYPFLYRAHHDQDSRYLDAALLLYRWMEQHVSQPDGSWRNDLAEGSWKGITVFGAIALAEALKNHGHILNKSDRDQMSERLKKAGDFIYNTFNMKYGNINYPVTASYALSLLGEILDHAPFRSKGKYFAHESLRFFTPNNKFLFGEGKPLDVSSPKGCLPVDLGYNVEESLPALVQYSLLTGDQEVLETARTSLKTHMEFMLPDGGWDNSWGTRNFKWTYWGSRTSDGCQPAYALLSGQDERFYHVALRNTQLLKACTHDGLLHGGPHYHLHGVAPCIHHTFCHAKALTTILDHHSSLPLNNENIKLPREERYGVKAFPHIQTWLIAKGQFRATVTGYDVEYSMKGGHATGGALSLLWHELAGPVLSASMNRYQLVERHNMQEDHDPASISLTPRAELVVQSATYKNVNDLKAEITYYEEGNTGTIDVKSRLVDENQGSPAGGEVPCRMKYLFSDEKVILKWNCDYQGDDGLLQVIFPVVSGNNESVERISDNMVMIQKEKCILRITADRKIHQLPVSGKRIFNFVPGFEAIPLAISSRDAEITIEVI